MERGRSFRQRSRGSRLVALALAIAGLSGCGSDDEAATTTPAAPETTTESQDSPAREDRRLARVDGAPRVETIATGLDVPWEIAFLPDGRALITERGGAVRILSADGELEDEPIARIPVSAVGEGGLLGLAIDPRFERNGFVYVYRTTDSGNEIARYRLRGDELTEDATIADGIEAGPIHDGGRLGFGPDDRLYISTGDAGNEELAQEEDGLNGKLLTLDPGDYRGEGARPEVLSLGHRNPQGFDWEPRTDRLVSDEHGPEGNDEVNVIREGANYGWPEIQGDEERSGLISPVTVYEDSIAPSGATFVSLPGSEWTGDYLIGALVGEQIRRVRLDGTRVVEDEPLFEGEFGRIRTVVEGPDGALYALTNNRDGRGTPGPRDDRVLRIVPPARLAWPDGQLSRARRYAGAARASPNHR